MISHLILFIVKYETIHVSIFKRIFAIVGLDILIVLFLQTIYRFFYHSIPLAQYSTTLDFQVYAVMDPTNLSIIISILFFIAIILIARYG